MYGLANALRYDSFIVLESISNSPYKSDAFVNADEDIEGVQHRPAHRFLRSVHNVRIERGWLDLRNAWGYNFPDYWDEGQQVYDPDNIVHQ